jgi:plastocyanin
MTVTRTTVAVVTALCAFALTACNGDDDDAVAPDEVVVTIADFAYDPATATTSVTAPVRFENNDGVVHTVTAGTPEEADPDGFNEVVDPDASVTVRVDGPGSYPYFCTIHPTMTGELIAE